MSATLEPAAELVERGARVPGRLRQAPRKRISKAFGGNPSWQPIAQQAFSAVTLAQALDAIFVRHTIGDRTSGAVEKGGHGRQAGNHRLAAIGDRTKWPRYHRDHAEDRLAGSQGRVAALKVGALVFRDLDIEERDGQLAIAFADVVQREVR